MKAYKTQVTSISRIPGQLHIKEVINTRLKKRDLFGCVLGVEWQNPLGPLGVILIASNALEPLGHRLLGNLLRVHSGGIIQTLIPPLGVGPGL